MYVPTESAPVDADPESAFAPDQLPDAVQLVAFADDQVSVDAAGEVTDVGEAEREIDGAGAVTDSVADCVSLSPPIWVATQYKVYVYVPGVVSTPVDWEPEVAFVPDQLPEATQFFANDVDQFMVAELPETIETGEV